jgi:hydrogenase-4 component E
MLKHWIQTYPVLDFISVGMLLSLILMNSLRRLESCLKAYVWNAWLLSALVWASAVYLGEAHLYSAAVLTVASKCVVIPLLLRKVIRELRVTHDVEPYVSTSVSLLVSFALVLVVYSFLAEGIFVTGISKNSLKISVSIILISLFVMMTRRKAITQVIGLLFMENGLFLAGFALTYGLPTIVELGVLFDMLMGVIILSVFLSQIKRAFISVDLDKLTTLKG